MTGWRITEGDCIEAMRQLEVASIDCVVTDPPYGIGFMGHAWDQPGIEGRRNGRPGPHRRRPSTGDHTKQRERDMEVGRDLSPAANRSLQSWCEAWASECLRVLKPGGHLLAFGGCRTYHRLAAGIEDAGFEIRDQMQWLFGSGFPKSRRLADGVGTALKPGHEPIVLARAPLAGTTQATFDAHGTGGLNIDACLIPVEDDNYARNASGERGHDGTRALEERGATDMRMGGGRVARGRWPANVVLDEDAAAALDAQTGHLHAAGNRPESLGQPDAPRWQGGFGWGRQGGPQKAFHDSGGASRFYYCAKTSTAERNAGLDGFPGKPLNWSSGEQSPGTFQSAGLAVHRNTHPTVKPIDLMRWLIRLAAPPGGIVLDPFTGSGTTGIAALREGRSFVGIEREAEYVELARARIVGDAPLLNAASEEAA